MAFCIRGRLLCQAQEAAGFWLLAVSSDLHLCPQTVIRNPFTVYRPSHRMTSNVLTHGSRLHGERTTDKWTHKAESRIRIPFTVYRSSHIMTSNVLTHG